MRLIDLTGMRFGRLVVISRAENQKKQTKWLCKCDCGNVVAVMGTRLRGDITHSCGCIQKEVTRNRSFTHGGSGSRLRNVWSNMMHRCYESRNREYHRYGGRGIKVCEEWHDYGVFYRWAVEEGYKEESERGTFTLERINNNGNYCPENCKWASIKAQSNNRRNNRILEFNGQAHTISEWSDIIGVKPSTLGRRINALGWSVERALTTPKCKNRHG